MKDPYDVLHQTIQEHLYKHKGLREFLMQRYPGYDPAKLPEDLSTCPQGKPFLRTISEYMNKTYGL